MVIPYENDMLAVHKRRDFIMKRIITLSTRKLVDTVKHGGCGACQTSCQSTCKTSCGVANQKCENNLNR